MRSALKPSDYVIATGITTTIRDFLRMAFAEIGVEIIFKGENVNEVAVLNYIDEKVFELVRIESGQTFPVVYRFAYYQ